MSGKAGRVRWIVIRSCRTYIIWATIATATLVLAAGVTPAPGDRGMAAARVLVAAIGALVLLGLMAMYIMLRWGRWTALMWVLSEKDEKGAGELLRLGCKVNDVDRSGCTPLMAAAEKCSASTLEALVAAGAEVNARSHAGLTALVSASQRDEPELAAVLLDAGAEVNALSGRGWTALMFASALGLPRVAQVLLEHGADPTVRAPDGRTAFELAAPHAAVLEVLEVLGRAPAGAR